MNEDVDFWLPSERLVRLRFPEQYLGQVRSQLTLATLGRLSDGASAKSVVSELAARYPESTEEYRLTAGTRFDAVDGVVRDINVQRDAARQLQLFLAASVLLALVAAANVSLFLLARAPGRRRELAIRMSVGAPLKRLARQLASEAGLLVLASAALGLLATLWLVSVIRGLAFLRQAEWSHVTLLDWRVLSLIGVFLLLITTLVSLAPILGLKRLGIAGASRQVAARATLAQRIAGSAQIAMAGSLGGAAIAFAWHLGAITLGDPGYELADRHHVRMYRVVSASDGPTLLSFDNAAVAAARRREVLQSVPAIRDITETSLVPAAQPYVNMIQVNDRLDPSRQISIAIGDIDSAFVDVLGLRLLYGHSPTENENDAALVNQALARRFFGRDDVVGESFDSSVGPPNEIVGVLEDLSFVHPAAEVAPMLLIKTAPFPLSIQGVIESPLTSGELRQQLQSLADTGELEFNEFIVTPLAALRDNLIAPDKARSGLTIATATLVVLVAAFGFYGTLRYLVASGRREYAIRASLGAGPRALGRLVFGRGLVLSLPGLVLGALLAFITVAWLRDDFVSREISAGTVAVGVVAGLVALLLLASVGPARMARRTQPAPLLRED
jgi:ABC-type antimicrobial peptide transport system permease subunit